MLTNGGIKMLIKLIKYEFKASYRFFLGLFALIFSLFVLMLLTKKNIEIGSFWLIYAKYILYMLSAVAFGIISAVSLTVVFVYAIIRFHRSMLGNEACLTHSLPVKTGSLVTAKIITMTVWAVLTLAVVCICTFCVGDFSEYIEKFSSMAGSWIKTAFGLSYKRQLAVIAIFMGINIILGFSKLLMVIYTSMSIGFSFNKSRKLSSFLCWLLISFILNRLSNAASELFGGFDFNSAYNNFGVNMYALVKSLSFPIITTLLTIVVLHLIANYFLEKRLNIQ